MTDTSSMQELPFNCDIAIAINDGDWEDKLDILDIQIKKLTRATLHHVLMSHPLPEKYPEATLEVSFLLTNDAQIQELNRDHRDKDKPTNVLSFPDTNLNAENLQEAARFEEPLILGDIVLAYETLQREAGEHTKTFLHHFSHLTVHGVLHLLGFDHMEELEAQRMERLEVEILAKMDIDNPYNSSSNQQDRHS